MTRKYYKITNSNENHHGFQYRDGLNILVEPFNDNPNESCCSGGFYFTDIENIFRFLWFGIYLREIELPTDDPDFKVIHNGDKSRCNK